MGTSNSGNLNDNIDRISLEAQLEDKSQQLMEALRSLKQMNAANKELMASILADRKAREEAETKYQESVSVIEALRRTKEHISTAILDALHKERCKVQNLERALQEYTTPLNSSHSSSSLVDGSHHLDNSIVTKQKQFNDTDVDIVTIEYAKIGSANSKGKSEVQKALIDDLKKLREGLARADADKAAGKGLEPITNNLTDSINQSESAEI